MTIPVSEALTIVCFKNIMSLVFHPKLGGYKSIGLMWKKDNNQQCLNSLKLLGFIKKNLKCPILATQLKGFMNIPHIGLLC